MKIDSTPTFATLEEEYTPRYCRQLEAAYGEGMMSEGGIPAIETLFEGVDLIGKKALDVGCGLGGVVFYLAHTYGMTVTGLEVNPWMVTEAQQRVASHGGGVDFLLTTGNEHWPLGSGSFDIIYSKGVFTHIPDKNDLFRECHRLLKDDGLFVINDWLSFDNGQWGPHIARLVELEHLALYAETEQRYAELLERNGFSVLAIVDQSGEYHRYNEEIVARLSDPELREQHLRCFSEAELAAAIEGYRAIVGAHETGELRVLRFLARKKP
ncbi:MAG: hypothetical protein QG604_366 [Candidatus Dependentiae bacterium]|nr:hypothetical protein [Candidatus Dependentiae bacterium]